MKLTNEQIKELSARSAEAARIITLWPFVDQQQLEAFTRAVIEAWQQMVSANEVDLVRYDQLPDNKANTVEFVNRLHRAARAADKAEIERLSAVQAHLHSINLSAERTRDIALADVAKLRAELAALKTPAPEDQRAGEVLWKAFGGESDIWSKLTAQTHSHYNSVAQTLLAWAEAQRACGMRAEGHLPLRDLETLSTAISTLSECALNQITEAVQQLLDSANSAKDLRKDLQEQAPIEAPPVPEGYHAATEEELKCLPVGYQWRGRGDDEWWNGSDIGGSGSDSRDYICPNRLQSTNSSRQKVQ